MAILASVAQGWDKHTTHQILTKCHGRRGFGFWRSRSVLVSSEADELCLLRPILPVIHLLTARSLLSVHDRPSPRYDAAEAATVIARFCI